MARRNVDKENTGERRGGRRGLDVLQRHFEWRCKIAVQFSFRGRIHPRAGEETRTEKYIRREPPRVATWLVVNAKNMRRLAGRPANFMVALVCRSGFMVNFCNFVIASQSCVDESFSLLLSVSPRYPVLQQLITQLKTRRSSNSS